MSDVADKSGAERRDFDEASAPSVWSRTSAERILKEYRNGIRTWDDPDTEMGCDIGILMGQSESELLDPESYWGDDAAETLGERHPDWGTARIEALIKMQFKPTRKEIIENAEWLLEFNPNDYEFIVFYKVIPIGREQPEAWVVVHSAGVPLEPEYELAGIFETADAATAFTERSFSLDAETSALDTA